MILLSYVVLLQMLQTKKGPTTFVHMLTCHIFHSSPAKGGGSGEVREWQWRTIRACARALMGGVASACSNLLKAIHKAGKVFLGHQNCTQKILNVWFISAGWMGFLAVVRKFYCENNFESEISLKNHVRRDQDKDKEGWDLRMGTLWTAWILDTVWRPMSDDTREPLYNL